MSSPLPSDAAEAAWLRQVWGPGRAGLLPNQAQNVDLGPEQLQIFAARYLDTVGLCVAPLQQNDALVTVGDADVVLLTSGEKAKIFHEKSNDDAVIDFDNAINGFYVCLNPEKKWSVSWPSQSSQPAASANTTRSSVSADANEFSTHESYEISIKVPKSDRAGAYSDCATVAMGMGLVVTVMFETEHDVDVDDIDSDEVPRMNRDGHYRIKEYRVDCNFINQKGLVILKNLHHKIVIGDGCDASGNKIKGLIEPREKLLSPSGGTNIKLGNMHDSVVNWKDWIQDKNVGKCASDNGEAYLQAYNTCLGASRDPETREAQANRLYLLHDPSPWDIPQFRLHSAESVPTWSDIRRNVVSTFHWTDNVWKMLENPQQRVAVDINASDTEYYVLEDFCIHKYHTEFALGQGVASRCHELFKEVLPASGSKAVPKEWMNLFNHAINRTQNEPNEEISTKRADLAAEIFKLYMDNDYAAEAWRPTHASAKRWIKTWSVPHVPYSTQQAIGLVKPQGGSDDKATGDEPNRKRARGGGKGRSPAANGGGRGRPQAFPEQLQSDEDESDDELTLGGRNTKEHWKKKYERLKKDYDALSKNYEKLEKSEGSMQDQVQTLVASAKQKDNVIAGLQGQLGTTSTEQDAKSAAIGRLEEDTRGLHTQITMHNFFVSAINNMYADYDDGGLSEDDEAKKKIAPFFRMALRSAVMHAKHTLKWERAALVSFFAPFGLPWTTATIEKCFA